MMQWKTDWGTGDNYGRSGGDDFNRLQSNLMAIAEVLREKYGITVGLANLAAQGYKNYPFADLLNAMEENLRKVSGLWPKPNDVPTVYPTGTFACGASVRIRRPMPGFPSRTWHPSWFAPTFADVNRWESMGEWAEQAIGYDAIYHECGTIDCGADLYEPYIAGYAEKPETKPLAYICGTCYTGAAHQEIWFME